MSHSLNEIETLAKRAARGSGLSWGQAEDAAKATRFLAAFGLPGPALLAGCLLQNEGTTPADLTPAGAPDMWRGAVGRLCPLRAGATMCDFASQLNTPAGITLQNVSHPLLTLAFAAMAARQLDSTIEIAWPGVRAITDGTALHIDGAPKDLCSDATVYATCHTVEHIGKHAATPGMRGTIQAKDMEILNRFATRTLAPATAESRRLGAG